jgi:hypothetical protein
MHPGRPEIDPPAEAERRTAEALREEDLDRLAAALASLLAAWWRRHEGESDAELGTATSEEVTAANDTNGRKKPLRQQGPARSTPLERT